jgi:hypothetical protein
MDMDTHLKAEKRFVREIVSNLEFYYFELDYPIINRREIVSNLFFIYEGTVSISV